MPDIEDDGTVAFDPTLLIAALVAHAGGEVELTREALEGVSLFGKYLVLEESVVKDTFVLRLAEEI